jgi:ABC-type multidrug transport system permease subunit
LQGGGWPAMWWNVIMIALIGAVFYGLGWRNLRRMQLAI